MSTTIDSRVVEMRFDNKQFERGVSDTMSTLEKLKQKLNFNGAVKGVESVNSAAKGVNANMSSLGGAVEQVSLKFSALQVMGVTALSRLTNSAITAGTRIAKALTIEPITTGFQEYETQINAVQTILANTSHAGTTIDDVNRALDDLNKYADQTIYNFTEMTRNIGTFTAAGVDLDTSTSAIKGIANLAAVSGSTSQQASTAMYQLSQALAAGRVSLMDWNSVVNAGMGGKVFQDALTRTSEVMGTGAKAAIEKYGSFRESLSKGEWLTTDVLTETLNQFTMAAEEGTEQWEEYKKSLKEKGYTEAQAVEILKMANTATDAATKVKTFTQLWDVLKESAQSGWSQTWKLIIGDFEEAKNLLTPISESLTGFINRMSDFRNAILKSALGRTFSSLGDKINTILKPASKAADVVKGAVDTIADLGVIVDDVILGKFGNGKERFDALTKAGVNYCEVQNKVNEKLGSSYRYTKEQIDAQNKLLGTQTETTKKTEEQAEETIKLTDAQKKQLKELGKMTDAQLKAAGYSDAQIKALKELKKTAEDLGIPFDQFIDQLDQINGRWLLINGFKNIGNALVDVGRAIGKAWKDIFPEHTVENFADKLFNLLGSFHKFTAGLADTFYVIAGYKGEAEEPIYKLTEAGEKLVRTFKGVFAALDVVGTLIGGGFKIAFKIVAELFDRFGLSILDVTAIVGDAIVGFRDWADSILNVSGVVDFLVPLVKKAAKFIADLVNAVRNSKWFGAFCENINKAADGLSNLFSGIPNMDAFQNLVKVLKDAGTAVHDWIQTLKDSENIPGDIIAGLVKGITGGVPAVLSAVFELAKSIISGICEVLGIHSPARAMIAIGGFIIAGLIQGILEGKIKLVDTVGGLAEDIWATMKTAFAYLGERIGGLFKGIWEFISNENGMIDWGKLFAGGMMGSLLWVLIQFANAFKGLTDGIGGIGDILEEAGDVLKKFGKVLTAYSWDLKAKALQKLAIAVAILVGAIVVLAQIDDIGKLWNAVGIIAALSGILVILAIAMDKMTKLSIDFEGKKIEGLKSGLLQIALAIGILAFVVKMVGDMDLDKAKAGFKGLAGIAVGLAIFMGALTFMSKYAKDVDKFGSVMLKLSLAMALMVGVVKLVGSLSANDIVSGILFAGGFVIFVNSIAKVAKSAGNNVSKVGGLMIKLTIAMGLMIGVCKLASTLTPEDMIKGAGFATGFAIFLRALVQCTKIGKKQQIAKLGGLIMSVSFSMLAMIGVCKLAGMLSVEEMLKGAAFALGFTLLVKAMVGILSIGSETKMAKVTGTIIAMSIAVGILAAVSVALGYVELGNLIKGVTAVSILCGMMALMVRGLKDARNVNKAIMMMAIAIGVMAAAIVALTFIDDTEKLMAATAALSIVMGMFALVERYSKNIKKAICGIAVMTVATGMLAGILYLLTNGITNTEAAIAAATSLGILMGAMAASLKIVAGAGPTAMAAMPAMGTMLLIVAGIAVILGVLDKFKVEPSIETATSISILLLAMAGVTAILTAVGVGAPAAIAGVAAFAIVVGGIGALMLALAGLNKLFPSLQEWLDSGIGILQKIGEGIGRFIGGFIGGIGEGMMDSLLDMVRTFGTIVEELVEISDVGTGIKTEGFDGVKKLLEVLGSIGLTTVGTSFADIFTLGGTSMEKFQTDGVAFFKAMKAIGEASTGITIDEEGLNSVTDAAGKLVDLQSKIEPIGGLASYLAGHTDLATFGENVKSFFDQMKLALGGLTGFRYDTAGLEAVTGASTELVTIQSSIEPIGGLAAAFKGRDDLKSFGENVKAFFDQMKLALGGLTDFTFDDAAKTALGAIITAATDLSTLQGKLEPIDGIIQWFTGREDLSTFGMDIAAFIGSMKTALAELEGIVLDEAALDSVIVAAGKLSEFQSKLEPMGSVITWFTGRTDLGTFGTNVGLFASGMAKLKTEMGEGGITEETVASITNAGNAIIELQKALPEEGWFDGKMNLSEFADYVTDFGTAMGTFAETASGIDPTAVSTAISTAHRIKNLITGLVGLDTSGLTVFTGIGTGGFGADGAAYKIAQAISAFSDEVAGIDTSAVSTSVSAASKIKNLIAGLVGLDTTGIENFKPEKVGSAMRGYADKVAGIDTAVVASSISSANRLKNLITSLVGLDTSGISSFRPQTIGDALKTYASSVSGMNTGAVNQSVSAANKLKDFISGLAGLNTSGVGSFKKALDDLSTVEVSKIVKAFSGAGPKLNSAGAKMMDGLIKGMQSKIGAVKTIITKILSNISNEITSKMGQFERAGGHISTKIASGISSKKNAIKSAVQGSLASAASSMTSSYTSFYSAGSYLVSGFVSGISANMYKATAKAKAMADAAAKAAREALKINSPSKVFKEIGSGIPEGFALGIKTMTSLIDRPLANMSSVATKSVSDTVSRLATAIDSDMDVQPTIRPVLDLSNIRSGAGAIGNMLGVGSSVGVLAKVGAISNSMNRRGQNVSNAEVVSAIDRLDRHLDNVGNTTYTIGGITYDDGSNIAAAVRDLTRHARIEGRV